MNTYYYELGIVCGSFCAENDEKAFEEAVKRSEEKGEDLLCVYTENEDGSFRLVFDYQTSVGW